MENIKSSYQHFTQEMFFVYLLMLPRCTSPTLSNNEIQFSSEETHMNYIFNT